jgi:hypothetical protein
MIVAALPRLPCPCLFAIPPDRPYLVRQPLCNTGLPPCRNRFCRSAGRGDRSPHASVLHPPRLSVVATQFLFWRASICDAFYNNSGGVMRPGNGTTARYIGAETDLLRPTTSTGTCSATPATTTSSRTTSSGKRDPRVAATSCRRRAVTF